METSGAQRKRWGWGSPPGHDEEDEAGRGDDQLRAAHPGVHGARREVQHVLDGRQVGPACGPAGQQKRGQGQTEAFRRARGRRGGGLVSTHPLPLKEPKASHPHGRLPMVKPRDSPNSGLNFLQNNFKTPGFNFVSTTCHAASRQVRTPQ